MPRRRIDDELWARVLTAYEQWDPTDRDAPTVNELIAPFGIAKQTFYNELKHRGVPLKNAQPSANTDAFSAVLEALVAAKIRIQLLENLLRANGIPLP
jgi:hypothetical protein